jgi:phosphate butyryltransferase
MVKSFNEILERVKGKPRKTIAVAMAEDEEVLSALANAYKEGIADAVLVGHRDKIIACSKKHKIDIKHFDIVHAETENQAVVRAVQLVREHLADTLMKGKCNSATLLKGVLDKQLGLRSGRLLSHIGILEVPKYPKLIIMTDGGMNIAPDISAKVSIIHNAIIMAKSLEINRPKVAVLAAIEKVNPEAMQCTVDAAALVKMSERGQIKDAIIDGPLALDNAISKRSCEIKGIQSEVGGDADILLMPNIESGNIFYKALSHLGEARSAGLLLGAKVPIILSSRADNDETKFYSIACGMITSTRAEEYAAQLLL